MSFTFYARVFGCQMNVADVHDLGERLRALGGREVSGPEQADLVLVNTCTVRKKAEDKALSYLGTLKHLAQQNGGTPYIVAMGCVIPRGRQQIARTHPHVSLLLDSSDPDIVIAALCGGFPPLREAGLMTEALPMATEGPCRHNFITAIRGCDHQCSYCVVPAARGPQRDVPPDLVLAHARQYEEAGVPDITVLGQNILAYGRASGPEHPGFADLMERLLAETGFRWITFLTSLPCDLTGEICERVIAQPRITPLLHLPLQSGSDRVLAAMRRGHDAAYYREIVAKARRARPELYLTTDLLVGFPTETEEDFAQTLALVEEVGFDDAFMFAYSPRPGTHSVEAYTETLSREQKLSRLHRLIARQRELGAARNRRFLGQELEVIIEEAKPGGSVARTAFNKPVRLKQAATPPGEYARVRITGIHVSSFDGEEVS